MSEAAATVFVIDDDPGVRRSLERLFGAEGFATRSYAHAEAYLADRDTDLPGCLVLDLRLPARSGLDLQDAITRAGWAPQIVFITGHGDIDDSVRAMRAGAVTFLTKPFDPAALLTAVREAVARDAVGRDQRARLHDLSGKLARLTPREAEVLRLVMDGQLNKQIAYTLGIVEKTVKVHRARAMEKIGARSIIEAVRLTAEHDRLLDRARGAV